MIQSLHRFLAQTDNQIKIVPGDGLVAPRADLEDYRDMLVKVRQRIQVLIAAGTTMDEAVAAAPTRDFDAQWGRSYVSPDVCVRMVFTSLIDSGNANR
jgi:cyclase